jgi:hypothetical protein
METTLPLPQTKLDLGCGPNKRQGFTGVDAVAFTGVDVVHEISAPVYKPIPEGFEWMSDAFERKVVGYQTWPWPDNSIDEVHCSHFVEHLDRFQRVHFYNELYRVLKPGVYGADGKPKEGFATIIVPHWSSCRAYGDFTHQWPPMSEFGNFYLGREWREKNAPHDDIKFNPRGLNCNFQPGWGYSLESGVAARNSEYVQYAMTYLKEACQDMILTITAIKP